MSDDREYMVETLGDWAHHPYKLTCSNNGKPGAAKFYHEFEKAERAGRTWVATGVQPADQRD